MMIMDDLGTHIIRKNHSIPDGTAAIFGFFQRERIYIKILNFQLNSTTT